MRRISGDIGLLVFILLLVTVLACQILTPR